MIIEDIATGLRNDPVDVLMDLVIDDRAELGVTLSIINSDQEAVGEMLTLPNVLIGLSDAEVHIDQHFKSPGRSGSGR